MTDTDRQPALKPQLVVVSLWAEDVRAAAHFYRDVLGLTLTAHHASDPAQARLHFAVPTRGPGGEQGGTGSVLVTLLKGRPVAAQAAEPERFPVIAFEVKSLAAAVERLRAHGVALPWGVEEDARARWVMFHDPAGNLIELAEFK